MMTAVLILTRRSFAEVLYARTVSVVTTNRTTLSLVCLKASPVDKIEEHYIGEVKSVLGQEDVSSCWMLIQDSVALSTNIII